MLETVKLIREKGLQSLTNELAIEIREYPGIVGLNYNQIESPKAHPVVMECRSLALYTDDWSVANRAFPRFFNFGEMPDITTKCDLTRAIVYEKYDGSLIKLWFNRLTNQWTLSTRSMLFAEGPHPTGKTFGELVKFDLVGDGDLTNVCNIHSLNRNFTLVFEWCSPLNRIVTAYAEPAMVLTAVFHNETGHEYSYSELEEFAAHHTCSQFRVKLAATYDMSGSEEILKAAANLQNLKEGYVALDPVSQVRVKIKSPAYVAVHNLRTNGTLSVKRVAELVMLQEHPEYLQYFSEDTAYFEPYIAAYDKVCSELDRVWNLHKDIENQKEFALAVKDYKFSGVLFDARRKKESPVHIFKTQCKMNYCVDLLLCYAEV